VSYPQLPTPEEKLADAKKLLGLPRIVVICGSTRFMIEMTEADLRETRAGKIVVKPGCDMKSPHELWSDPVEAEALKVRLDNLHRAKIRLADEVLVVGDYIGDSTRAEITYARSLGSGAGGSCHGDAARGRPAARAGSCHRGSLPVLAVPSRGGPGPPERRDRLRPVLHRG